MRLLFERRYGVETKLKCVALLAVAALCGLGLASIRFAQDISTSAIHLRTKALTGLVASAELGVLVERHRRIIEAAPITFDKLKIQRDRRLSDEIAERLETLVHDRNDHFLRAIERQIPDFKGSGHRVLKLAENFAQDEALKAVEDYVRTAGRLQSRIVSFREISLANARRDASSLMETVRQLVNWVLLAALFAAALVGPLTVYAVRRIAERLGQITETMRRLAQNDIQIPIPSRESKDEIGEMARAVEVFKSNAIALAGKHTEVARLNSWFDIALNNMARGLSMFDADGRLIVCNCTYRDMYGLPDRLTQSGMPFTEIVKAWTLERDEASPAVPEKSAPAVDVWLAEHRAKVASGTEFSFMHRLPDSRVYAIHCRPLADGGWVDLHEDITEKQRSTERISELASKDTLTGLANRRSFLEELGACFAPLEESYPFAILWIDLDRFKEVNDTYGHPAGDALLQIIAGRLRAVVRGKDFVARLGGDEFAIIMRSGHIDRAALTTVAARLTKAVTEPCQILGQSVSVGASIGISCAPFDANTPEDLMITADIALYQAKAHGRGRAIFYDSRMAEVIQNKRRLQADLEDALRLGQLDLYYQPIVAVETGRVVCLEALMRWHHPVRGFISPTEFIPLAEEAGLISAMGVWALETACRTAAAWPDNIAVSVNLSAAQFGSSDLKSITAAALADSGLAPSRLQFEVTETLFLDDKSDTWAKLASLKELGVSMALDDFGTGYSSLSYLRAFPFDKIKIDQSFIRDLGTRKDGITIVHAIIDLARTLGMKTVAEGVETREHLQHLATLNCDEVQGYLFSKPVPAHEVESVLARLVPVKKAA